VATSRFDTGDRSNRIAPYGRGVIWRRTGNPEASPVRTPGVWQAADDALVAGMAAGDAEAARALVRRHQRRVVGLAATIVGDADTAEDVAQEAFTRVWRHAATYDPLKASVLTWLLTITRNLAIDNIRLRRAVVVDPDTLVGLEDETVLERNDPADRAVGRTEADRLRVALAAIPREQRDALVLAGVLGLTAAEVAEREQIPLGTAKTRIRSAMRKLRADLETEQTGRADP
jgi:RNA polymerase sigma-70 factor (ECF subfamily)